MSNPVKNAEIEDVLSSIRRLVSESHVGVPIAPAREDKRISAPVNEQPSPKVAPDRLVLSPALRVEDVIEELPAEKTSPVQDTPFANSLKEDILPLRETLPSFLQQRLDANVENEASEFVEKKDELSVDEALEPETDLQADETFEDDAESGKTLKFPAPEELVFETAREVDAALEETAQIEPTKDELVLDDSRPWEIEGERLAEWHSVRGDEPEHFEPDGPEDGDNAGTPVATLNWEDHESDIAVEEAPSPENPEVSVADPVAEKITEDITEEFVASDGSIDAQQYDAVLDEEMLRELVGEIVREELQGPLGERITRNVRKLVRREINRALTARNFNDS